MALSKREKARRKRRSNHNYHLKKNYGITIYDKILAAQGGKCAICKGGTSKNFFAVDHNHKNGNVRGLLCARCNTALARFMDKAANVGRAYKYMLDDGKKVKEILECDS